eukprot:TRINITY_DN739_c0_g5_i1.p3 TRINITY_DN739_c0_g5~~TRINITY_DN739_c0_g5_i1.p3  ORF type:complete len:185 (-),score=66.80 TRINITY_DN739_c0_g5_i1:327-881(-)
MDIWGTGCVLFEVLSLFPLFPGNNELDQVHKIHNIFGTPRQEVLDSFQKHATHMEFNFKSKEGTGIAKLIPHVSAEAQDLISKMLAYTEGERITAKQALSHPWFQEFRGQDKSSILSGSLAFSEEGYEEEKKPKRPTKDSEYHKNLKKLQQGSNKNLEPHHEIEKRGHSIDSDEPTFPGNVSGS